MEFLLNEIVKYENSLNDVSFRKFNPNELDLFFSICSKLKDKYTQEIEFSFEQLKELSNYSPTSVKRFMNDLDKTYTKMLGLTYGERTETRIKRFVLFTKFDINADTQTVKIGINNEFEFLLNDFEMFTKFELKEFTEINSSYTKTIYRKLKQFKGTGFYTVSIEEFKRLLDIPKSYRMYDIDRRILEKSIKELKPFFKSLSYKKEKAKKGNKIERISFIFEEKKQVQVPLYDWVNNKEIETQSERYKSEKSKQEKLNANVVN